MIPNSFIEILKRQKYHLVGSHSAVKKCRWLHESLVRDRHCYKEKFYGIRSHRCLQMTPAVAYCNQACLWCWRVMSGDIGLSFNDSSIPSPDDAARIVEGCIYEQRRILSGYKAQVKSKRVPAQKYEEACEPKHAAISLAGEPTLYPFIGELIYEFKRRGFTTFLVSNGTNPDVLEKIEEPTQLYLTLGAPNEEIYRRVCRPNESGLWKRSLMSLDVMRSFSCPTVIRLTLAKEMNMLEPEGYAKLILKADPTYVECKAMMAVGYGLLSGRIGYENMPSFQEIKKFSEDLSSLTGMKPIGEHRDSRVVLLSKLERPIRFRQE
ncbi:MAG: 4-demethylwyosine synthase TYW1 [Thermoproteota archaeon]